MLLKIVNFFEQLFHASPQSELEQYLSSKNIETPEDLNFHLQIFDERKRFFSSMLAHGNYRRHTYEQLWNK